MSTNHSDKIVEVKAILRSLLIARANCCTTVRQLSGAYKEMEERNIPFREFGYTNLIEFLNDIPDTLSLYTNTSNEICVRHVDSEKSSHITSLVARQKKTKPPTRKKLSYRPPHSYSRPINSYNTYNKASNYHSQPTYNYNGISTNFSATPAHINGRVSNSFSLNKFSNNNTIKPFMNYAPLPLNKYNGYAGNSPSQPTQFHKDTFSVLKMTLKSMKNSKTTTGIYKADVLSKVKKELGQHVAYSLQNLNDHLVNLSHLIELEEDYIYFRDELACIKEQERRKVNAEKAAIATTIDCQHEVPISKEEKSKDTCIKEPPISKDLSNKAFETMESHYQNSNCRIEQNSPSMKANPVGVLIKDTIKFRLQKLIENHPEGIWCSDLPNEYKKEYNLDLEYLDLGFNSITEFVAALPEIFLIVEPSKTSRQMVLNAKQPAFDSERHQKQTLASLYNYDDYVAKEPEPVPIKLSRHVSQKLFPDGYMKPNETVNTISVTALSMREYIEINISEVFTPSFFWVTLRENKKKFQTMMNELDEFYKRPDLDTLKVAQVVLEAGLNIACIYAKIWHRGIIKKIKPDGYVVILFYDYGTVSTYHPDDLFYLHKKFSTLPAQAIASGLYNVKPVDTLEWPYDCIQEFVNKVWKIPMVAFIVSANEENNTMMISLTDTSDDINDLHINDWMVENNYASWGKMEKGVPLHTLALYDETNIKYITSKEKKKSSIKESSFTSSTSSINNNTDSSLSNSSVRTLVQESIGILKQTHTITQAILLHMPLTKSDDITNDYIPESQNIREKNNDCTSKRPQSLNFNSFTDNNLDSKFCSMKDNVTVNNSYLKDNKIHNGYKPLSQNSKNKSDYDFHTEQINQCFTESRSLTRNLKSKDELSVQDNKNGYEVKNCTNDTKCDSNFSKRPSSIYSTSSNLSDCSQSINGEFNGTSDYDRLTVKDGTISFERVVDSNLKNAAIDIKYPSKFAAELENNKNSINVDCNANSKHQNEIDEGYSTARPSPSQTNDTLLSTLVTSNSSNSTPPISPIYFVKCCLSEKCDSKLIHIFHLENNGWVCTTEVVDAFTNYFDERILFKLIEIFNYNVMFKSLTRKTDPQIFSQLDESQLKAPRDENNKIKSDFVLTLMTLKTMTQILTEFDFIDSKMLKEAIPFMKKPKSDTEDVLYSRFNNKILFDVLNLVVQYKKFKQSQSLSTK